MSQANEEHSFEFGRADGPTNIGTLQWTVNALPADSSSYYQTTATCTDYSGGVVYGQNGHLNLQAVQTTTAPPADGSEYYYDPAVATANYPITTSGFAYGAQPTNGGSVRGFLCLRDIAIMKIWMKATVSASTPVTTAGVNLPTLTATGSMATWDAEGMNMSLNSNFGGSDDGPNLTIQEYTDQSQHVQFILLGHNLRKGCLVIPSIKWHLDNTDATVGTSGNLTAGVIDVDVDVIHIETRPVRQ